MTVNDTPTAVTDADRAQVVALTQQVVAAWAYQDAESFASLFTEDGTMILAGVYEKGRNAVRAHMTQAFATTYKGTQVTGKPLDMRFLASDVCLMLTMGGVLRPGESEPGPTNAIRASWLAVRGPEGWRLAAYQNSPRDAR